MKLIFKTRKAPPSPATWPHEQQGHLGYSVDQSAEKQVLVFVTGKKGNK